MYMLGICLHSQRGMWCNFTRNSLRRWWGVVYALVHISLIPSCWRSSCTVSPSNTIASLCVALVIVKYISIYACSRLCCCTHLRVGVPTSTMVLHWKAGRVKIYLPVWVKVWPSWDVKWAGQFGQIFVSGQLQADICQWSVTGNLDRYLSVVSYR